MIEGKQLCRSENGKKKSKLTDKIPDACAIPNKISNTDLLTLESSH